MLPSSDPRRALYLGYVIPIKKDYFSFQHSTWDNLRLFAKKGGEVRQRTLYSLGIGDYIRFLQDNFFIEEEVKFPAQCLIFEAWVGQEILAVAIVNVTPTQIVIKNYFINVPGIIYKAGFALMYEILNFTKNNLYRLEVYDECDFINNKQAFNI